MTVRVEIDSGVLDLLIRMHWLAECDAGDRAKIADAVGRMLAASAKNNP